MKKTITITYDKAEIKSYLEGLVAKNDLLPNTDREQVQDVVDRLRVLKNDLLSGASIEGLTELCNFLQDVEQLIAEVSPHSKR